MNFEEILVTHGSPTLANLKPASLISLRNLTEGPRCVECLEKKGLSFLPLVNRSGMRLVLVYRRKSLEKALEDPVARQILEDAGYMGSLDGMLEHLSFRFLSTDCPHEVGLFLGYPPDDVKGFIDNGGKNAISSGLWKVYCDLERAEKILGKWTKCRMKYIECFLGGTDISRLCVTA